MLLSCRLYHESSFIQKGEGSTPSLAYSQRSFLSLNVESRIFKYFSQSFFKFLIIIYKHLKVLHLGCNTCI